MSHHWDSGVMVRLPSWHRLENAVLPESPASWEEGRIAAGLTWEVETQPVFAQNKNAGENSLLGHKQIEGWQLLTRNDTDAVLSIQPESYRVVHNYEFGDVIDAILGLDEDETPNFEAIFSLYGGRQIVALCYFPQPLEMPWDPSKNYTYCALNSRHDGQGGVRGIPTNVRVQCANTWNLAEEVDGRSAGFTIRHTSNWKERVAEIRARMIMARGASAEWVSFTEQLALWKAGEDQRETYLKKMFPIGDDMEPRQRDNAETNRDAVRRILASPTCEPIANTGYGLLMATTEWSDHVRPHRSVDSYINRQLTKDVPKVRAGQILAKMADVRA